MLRNLNDFAGTWRFERQVVARVGLDANVTGIARYEAQGADLILRETGTMVLPDGGRFEAAQTYIWRAGAAGQIDVFFADGRVFHSFSPGAEHPVAHHFCDPDDYDVVYGFSGPDVFSTVWTVKGPRKDYVSRSHYSRVVP